MHHTRRLGIVLGVYLLASGAALSALAQEATPDVAAFPFAPDPALCQIAPRPASDLAQFAAAPGATPGAMDESAAPTISAEPTMPVGQPADAETTAALTRTVVERFACYNANDMLRAYALWTDRQLAWLFAGPPLTQEDLAGILATPGPRADADQLVLLAVRDVTILPDGRVAARVDVAYPDGTQESQYGIAVLEDGDFRLDEVVFVTPLLEDAASGTPAP